MAKPNASPMRVIEETPGYWRAVFDYPPFNVVDGDVFQALQDLLVRMETTEGLRARREQRVRSCLRHAVRLAREHEARPPRTWSWPASRGRRHRAPSAPGGARAGARNRSECQRLRWRHSGTIRLCEPITSGRRTGRLRRCPRTPD